MGLSRLSSLSCLVLFGFAVTEQSTQAASTVLNSEISVSYAGLPVGTLKHSYTVSQRDYAIRGSMKSNPLLQMLTGSSADYASAGRIRGNRLVPLQQSVSYQTRKRNGAISLSFQSGNVETASISPKRKLRRDAVPLTAEHRVGVLDPVSALVVTVDRGQIGDGQRICNRTVPVFDGRVRYNLRMSYHSSQRAATKGFTGQVHTCSVRYQPVAGHRPNRANVKRLVANRSIRVSLARIGDTTSYGLFGFSAKIRGGTAIGRAERFALR
ncbi:MAG: DUF3108 domain-containing protein [Ahrensia sp.]|nr:DUF3108 domain-containing protein [Ahrensia sp.]